MKEKLSEFVIDLRRRWSDERLKRRVYIACTAAALAASGLILAFIAYGEAEAASHGLSAPMVSPAPDEGETLPLGKTDLPSPSVPLPPSTSPSGEGAPLAEPSAAPTLTLEISDAEASGLLALALAELVEVERAEARFTAPDALAVDASATRESVAAWLGGEGYGVAANLVSLLPDPLSLSLELSVAADGDGGVALAARGFAACGVDLGAFLPDSLGELASDAINSALDDAVRVASVEVRDGSMTLLLEV